MPEESKGLVSHRGIPINVEFEQRIINVPSTLSHRLEQVEVTSGQVLEPAITAPT
jgi:hypothetical protein